MTPARPALAASQPVKRAILYLRQSMEKEESISLENQEHAGREYCRQRGYVVVAVLAEQVTGRSWRLRDKAQTAVRMIESGDADVIVVWRWNRFARNRRDWAVALDHVEGKGGQLESSTQPIDTSTPAGRFARGMFAEMAAFESELIGETWREAHDNRRRRGLTADGGRRYGYDRVDGAYQPNPLEAAVLAEMYERAASGQGYASIARWANEAGHRTRNGNEWSRVTVRSLLDSGFGAGQIIHRPYVGGRRDTNPHHATFHPGIHQPVVDEVTWRRYLARRGDTTDSRRPAHGGYMLSGLVRCGDCGAPMHIGSNHATDYYRCARATSGRPGRKLSMTRRLVEQAVTEWVLELPRNLDAIAESVAAQRATRQRPADDPAAIEQQLRRNQERAVKLTLRHLDGAIPDATYAATTAELDRERQDLTRRLANAAASPATRDVRALVRPIGEGWPAMPPSAQNAVLRALVAAVLVKAPVRQGTGVWRERVVVVGRWEQREAGE